jgi:NADH-quinone oxidoreductase subunit C
VTDAGVTEDAATDTADAATDDRRAGLLAVLEERLGDAVVQSFIKPGIGLWVRVRADAWSEAGEVARDRLGCAFFDFLSAIDWFPSPFGRYEDAELDAATSLTAKVAAAHALALATGYAGGDTRFQLLARVVNVRDHHDVLLKADVPDDALAMPTWSGLYAGANWHEREVREMFGIDFVGHPDMRNLYLPGEFEGYPLRKDFPLLSRVVKPWPGIVDVEPMPGEEPGDAEPTEEVSG